MTLLEVKDIRAGYNSGPDILNGISFHLEAGIICCIIGPNGAGKSTLLRTIAGLLKPRRGEIYFQGKRVDGLRPDQVMRHGLCLVPQERGLFPDMTVRENLEMGGYVLNDRQLVRRRIEEVFEMFPMLREKAPVRARALSGGQQQMLAIGRALILRPALVMLDEPTLGLEPRVAEQIFETVRGLKAKGITVLMVEQNARKGLECADWGIVLDLGQKRFEGPAHTVLSDPRIRELYLGKRLGKAVAAQV